MTTIPLHCTETTNAKRYYGNHPLPESTDVTLYDIPCLLAQDCQVPSPEEWQKWGRWKRSERATAWHFYTTDTKFVSILRDPLKLVETGAHFAVEPNVTSYDNDPLPVALAGLYRKRCVSRIWQEHGVNVFVDLNVAGITRYNCLDGVSRDHYLYATKYMVKDLNGTPCGLSTLVEDYQLAARHVKKPSNIKFLVYGGGKKVKAFAEDNGWLWIPNANNRRK
jgi:hypothetical protein